MFDQILIIVSVTALVLVAPGPDMLIVTKNTIAGGRSAGYRTAAGVLAGNLVHISYCVVGIGLLISQSIVAFSILKYAGAAYLIYLGIMSFRESQAVVETEDQLEETAKRPWFVQGFVNNVLNPKGTLFFLGVFTTVITPDTSTYTTLVLISIMLGMCATFWWFFIRTLDTAAIRNLMLRSQQSLSRVFGVLLIAIGIRVAAVSR